MSTQGVSHVSHADNIKKALRSINTGYGDPETQDTALHPWGIFAFVSGFEIADEPFFDRAEFMRVWRNASSRMPSIDNIYNRGHVLANQWLTLYGYKLDIVKCGRVGRSRIRH